MNRANVTMNSIQVGLKRNADPGLRYPGPEDFFSPGEHYPEYPFPHLSRQPNPVYRYRPQAVRCEDSDLLLRAHRYSEFRTVDSILLGYHEPKINLHKRLLSRRSWCACVRDYHGTPYTAALTLGLRY